MERRRGGEMEGWKGGGGRIRCHLFVNVTIVRVTEHQLVPVCYQVATSRVLYSLFLSSCTCT